MRRYLFLSAIVVTALVTALPAVSVSAATTSVLTTGRLGGARVAVGHVLTSGLKSGTMANFYTNTGTTGVSCSRSSFSATVKTNPTAPGTAAESLTSQKFGNCTTNITGASGVQSVTLGSLPYAVTVNDSGDSVTVSGSLTTTITLNTFVGAVTCTYAASTISGTKLSISGRASNTDNSITFTNQPFKLSSGSILCYSSGLFSATYAPVVDSSQAGSPRIFTN
jgi:hypothetical protein